MTHYIAYFTVEGSVFRGQPARSVQAVCGAYVDRRDHTAEPTCSECKTWLEKDAIDTLETAEALGLVLEDGVLVPRLTAKGSR